MNLVMKNRIGMFDSFKGLGMILIVLGHSISFINLDQLIEKLSRSPLIFFGLPIWGLGISIMPAFLIISGYGFRKKSMKTCIEQQAKLMLKPYAYTMIGCSALHILTRYLMSRSIRATLMQTVPVTGGFLLALPEGKMIAGTMFMNCGAMWYMISLFWGWIILNALMNYVPEKYMIFSVCATICLGWMLGLFGFTYFCLSQGCIATGYLYIGHMIKKQKLLNKDFSKWMILGLILLVVEMSAGAFTGVLNNMAESVWALGPVSILFDGFVGIIVIYLVLLIDSKNFYLKRPLAFIGANSLYIFAAHTIDIHGIPWYLIYERIGDKTILCFLVVVILRVIIITLIVAAIKKYIKISRSLLAKN